MCSDPKAVRSTSTFFRQFWGLGAGSALALALLAQGSRLAAAERAGYGRERFVVYTETDFRGEVKADVLGEDAYDVRAAEVARMNRVLRQAYLAAAKAWAEDEARKGVPFPMRTPQLLQISRIATYSTREKAEDALARRQERLDKRAETARQAEERRLASLSDAARAKEKEKAGLLKAAEALFLSELQRLAAASATKAAN